MQTKKTLFNGIMFTLLILSIVFIMLLSSMIISNQIVISAYKVGISDGIKLGDEKGYQKGFEEGRKNGIRECLQMQELKKLQKQFELLQFDFLDTNKPITEDTYGEDK